MQRLSWIASEKLEACRGMEALLVNRLISKRGALVILSTYYLETNLVTL